METKGIIISQKDYERLKELEKNFDNKVEENRESFKKGLEDAIRGDLVKILWVKDKYYADIKGCDLSDGGADVFISREDADIIDRVSSKMSYNRKELIKDVIKEKSYNPSDEDKIAYEEIISNYKKATRNLWWAFVIMFTAWLVQLILYIAK